MGVRWSASNFMLSAILAVQLYNPWNFGVVCLCRDEGDPQGAFDEHYGTLDVGDDPCRLPSGRLGLRDRRPPSGHRE